MADNFEKPAPKTNLQLAKELVESLRKTNIAWLGAMADQFAQEIAKSVDQNIEVPGVSEERIKAAREAIDSALRDLKEEKLHKFLLSKGVNLRDAGFYMSIAVKETLLNPRAKGSSGDLGYFQIIPKFALAEVNNKILVPAGQTALKDSDIYYDGDDPTKMALAAKKNAMAGVLYWHVCRNIYQKNVPVPETSADRDQLADFMYNLGPINARNLLRSLAPKSFKDFAKSIAEQMAKQHPEVIVTNNSPKSKDAYKVSYLPVALKVSPIKKANTWTQIGDKKYSTEALLFALEYPEVLKSLREIIVI